MLYFLEKVGKISAALGAPPPTPVGLRRLGALPPDPPSCYSHYIYVLFLALRRFLDIVKIKITT